MKMRHKGMIMTLTLLKDVFSAYGFRLKAGATVTPVQFDGPWLECGYGAVDPLTFYIHVHEDLLMAYFGVTVDQLPPDIPKFPSLSGSA